MDLSASSEDLPLQPYRGDRSSEPSSSNTVIPTSKNFTISDDVELRFLRVVGRNKLIVVQPNDIKLEFPDWRTDTSSRSGLTMQVHRGVWRGRRVALKRIHKRSFDDRDEISKAEAMQDYGQAMYDLLFELQIMSKKSLSDHRNITKLLAVSFDTVWENDVDSTNHFVLPILIVELADDIFPDLGLFFDSQHTPSSPKPLPFETAATLIADIADGVTALHKHEIVHADLKPSNILIFPDHEAPCGLVAKVSDFGFSGMTTYTSSGQRAWLPDSRPRGGTTEWNAPECISDASTFGRLRTREQQSRDMPSRDIYSFGLLSSYIALDGQSPKTYIKDIQQVKLSDRMAETVKIRLKEYHSDTPSNDSSLGNLAARIADITLRLDCSKREKHLGNVRRMLFGNNFDEKLHPSPTRFVLDFNLFPDTEHEFRCDGLHEAYWQSPPAFRNRVVSSFERHSSGSFGQFVAPGIWACLRSPGNIHGASYITQ